MRISKKIFDPHLTCMDSAQAFNWNENDGNFAAIYSGREIFLENNEGSYDVRGDLRDDEIIRLLGLDNDYDGIFDKAADIPFALEAYKKLPGLRVMNQPVWDTLLTFICSANNNTKRIRSLVMTLCREFGTVRNICGMQAYGLPDTSALAGVGEKRLAELKFGYRAGYLDKTANMVNGGFDIESAAFLPYADAKKKLMCLAGVGPKVADCVLLFGCGHMEAFPVDVWVGRLLKVWYGIEASSPDKAAEAARAYFGPNAGIIQQYLFHCARCGLISLSDDTAGGKE